MKKNIKSVVAKSLAVVMAFNVAAIAPSADSEAASKKPSLAKKATVYVGKTKTIKVTGKAKVKKTTWSLNKAGKKVVSLSAKKAKSVKVKGKKTGKATLTAKIKVGKKTYKKTCKITVKKATVKTTTNTNTAAPTSSATAPSGGTNTPAPTDNGNGKVSVVNGQKIDESQTYSIQLTELNETTLTSVLKRPEDAEKVADYTTFSKDGVSFTATADYNSGVSFYINPCTNDNQLVDLSRGDGYLGFQDAQKDMSDYDYIRVELTSENEMNFRTYNGYDALESESFPGSCTTETYEAKWVGPVAADEYLGNDGGTGRPVKDGYLKRTVFVPIADLIVGKGSEAGSGCDFSTLTAIAISPQRENIEATIHSIDFVKVERTNKVSSISVACKDAEGNDKTVIANNKAATLTATVGPDNASRKIVKWTSSDETLATIDFQGNILANNKDKTGECTFTATATDGSEVSGSIKLKIGDDTTIPSVVETQKVDFSNAGVKASEGATKTPDMIKFKAGANETFVDFSGYIDTKNIDLSKYDSVQVTWEVQDATGKTIDSYEADEPTNGKVAFAASGSLNGHSDGFDTRYDGDDDTSKQQLSISSLTGDTQILTIANMNPADVPKIAGFNLQLMDKIPATYSIVIKEIKFVKNA